MRREGRAGNLTGPCHRQQSPPARPSAATRPRWRSIPSPRSSWSTCSSPRMPPSQRRSAAPGRRSRRPSRWSRRHFRAARTALLCRRRHLRPPGCARCVGVPATFGTPADMVQGIIAGGPEALVRSIEGAEDSREGGAAALATQGVRAGDVVVGIAAGGATPFVHGALRQARATGSRTVLLVCAVPPPDTRDLADLVIHVDVGPELVTGSTRLKAGTATKLVLNMLTTGAMIRIGKTYGNLMVDLQATNAKLRDRGERIVMSVLGVTREVARQALADAQVASAPPLSCCTRAPDLPPPRRGSPRPTGASAPSSAIRRRWSVHRERGADAARRPDVGHVARRRGRGRRPGARPDAGRAGRLAHRPYSAAERGRIEAALAGASIGEVARLHGAIAEWAADAVEVALELVARAGRRAGRDRLPGADALARTAAHQPAARRAGDPRRTLRGARGARLQGARRGCRRAGRAARADG